MHIKRIHEMIEKVVECANSQLAKGANCTETEEMEKVACIIKNLNEAEYYAKISKAMDESKAYETMEMYDYYNDNRRFYNHYRYADGRYAPKGKGEYHRGYYSEPMYYMTPEMYNDNNARYYRDMDRNNGKMYYTETNNINNSMYEKAKRGYEESKIIHNGDSVENKQAKMRDLEEYIKELSTDVTHLISDATPEEKAMVKTKLQTLMQKF